MKILNYWKPIIVALVILYGSLTSGSKLPDVHLFNFEHYDKIVHFILYFALTITLYNAFLKQTKYPKNKNILMSLLISAFYGLIMESFQYLFTNDRSPEILDVLANILGAITGVLIYPLLVKLKLHKYL